MDNAVTVGVREGFSQLSEEAIDLSQGKPARLHPGFERACFEITHNEIGDAVAFTIIENRQDVRVFKPGNDARLLLKACDEFRTLCQLTWQDFDRDVPIHGWLIRLIDSCHTALPNL